MKNNIKEFDVLQMIDGVKGEETFFRKSIVFEFLVNLKFDVLDKFAKKNKFSFEFFDDVYECVNRIKIMKI